MRILMLADLYPPVIGGSERHVYALAHELADRGHQVAVATVAAGDAPEAESDGRVHVYRLRGTMQSLPRLFSDPDRPYAPPAPDPALVRGLRRVTAIEQPEVVHAHGWLAYSYLPLKAHAGAPLLMTLHDYGLACPTKTLMRQGQPCAGPRPSKCLTCASAHYGPVKGLTVMGARGLFGGKLVAAVDRFLPVSGAVAAGSELASKQLAYEVIPNFYSSETGDLPECVGALPDGDFMLFVGALGRHKGLHWLLDVYSRLNHPLPLVLIGSPWTDTPASFPDGVQVIQDWPHAAVLEAWRRCLFGIVPSLWGEPCPTVAMEAMDAGKPLIATRIGGLPDMVEDGVSGLLVTPGDSAGLAQAIRRLTDDAKLRRRMGQASRRKSLEFQAKAVVPRIEHAYQELLAA
jgi:glycosyltransferase involved in cell wall biosynthesis